MTTYRLLFWLLVYIGRPFGGIRPHRVMYWLYWRAFTRDTFSESDYAWWRDRWGSELLLNPRYHLDFTIIAFGCYDGPLHRWIDRRIRGGTICFDVGANIGAVTTHLARNAGAAGRVYAFEPVAHLRSRLAQNLTRNHLDAVVSIHELALSNQIGQATLAVAPVDADNTGLASLVARHDPRLTTALTVATTTLDEFIRDRAIDRIDFIKVDIEGGEILFLEGARATLERFAPDVILEVAPDNLAGGGRTSRDLLLLLESCGYRIHEIRSDGSPGARIHAAEVPPAFARENVYCTRQSHL